MFLGFECIGCEYMASSHNSFKGGPFRHRRAPKLRKSMVRHTPRIYVKKSTLIGRESQVYCWNLGVPESRFLFFHTSNCEVFRLVLQLRSEILKFHQET